MLPAEQLPFVRLDKYGEGGWAPQPAWERLRLALLVCTLLPLRAALCLACVASYYLIVRLACFIPHEVLSRRIVTVCGKAWSRACLFCLGFVSIHWLRVEAGSEHSSPAPLQSGE